MSNESQASNTIHVLYFASLGDALGCQKENFTTDKSPLNVAELRLALSGRGDAWQRLTEHETIRCAINQELALEDSIIPNNAEVAFFPPVTGG